MYKTITFLLFALSLAAQDPGVVSGSVTASGLPLVPLPSIQSTTTVTVPDVSRARIAFSTAAPSFVSKIFALDCGSGDYPNTFAVQDDASGLSHTADMVSPPGRVCFRIVTSDAAKVPYVNPPQANGSYPLYSYNTKAIDATASTDFDLFETQGPAVLFENGSIYIETRPRPLAGPTPPAAAYGSWALAVEDSAATFSPASDGLSVHWLCNKSEPGLDTKSGKHFCIWGLNGDTTNLPILRVTASAAVPPGNYTVTAPIAVMWSSTVTRNLTWSFSVLPAAKLPTRKMPAAVPPIPALDVWDKLMVSGATANCLSGDLMAFGYEGQVWYYDGGRVILQTYDRHKDNPALLPCAQNILNQFADRNYPSSIQGWRMYPSGLKMWAMRYRDPKMALAVHTQALAADFWGNTYVRLQRETAISLEALIASYQLGFDGSGVYVHAENPMIAYYAERVMNQLETAHQPNIYFQPQPFYDGISMQALTMYYEHTVALGVPDYRAISIVKRSMDYLWANAVIQTGTQAGKVEYSTLYSTSGFTWPNNIGRAYAQLNNLFASAWAWYWNLTGDATVLAQGDFLFAHSFDEDLGGYWNGKQFSQNGMDSPDYVWYRSNLSPVKSLTDPSYNQYDPATAATLDTTSADISAVTADPTTDGAVITWTTSQPASTFLMFGATAAYTNCWPDCNGPRDNRNLMSTAHSMTITGLTGGTYHYRVQSRDAVGHLSYGSDAAFTVLVPPPPKHVQGVKLAFDGTYWSGVPLGATNLILYHAGVPLEAGFAQNPQTGLVQITSGAAWMVTADYDAPAVAIAK